MGTSPIFLYTELSNSGLDLAIVGRDTPLTPEEKLKQIENLHEGVAYKAGEEDDDVDTACAECQMPHPCATYKIINPRNDNGEEAPF